MAGRRRNPCEFCEDNITSEYIDGRNGYCIWYEFYPFNNLLSFLAQANDENGELIEDGIDINVQYCPVCGRKLEDA